jgi:hypothetical protein
MVQSNIAVYRDALKRLIGICHHKGISVRFVHDRKILDYAGHNSYAAKAMGFKMPKNTIYIDESLNYKGKYRTLKHEYDEFNSMKSGNPYWQAHRRALVSERRLI